MATYLGIDTSNYTTSAAVSVDGTVVKNIRVPLRVAQGERGLRQSDAVFQHTVNLPTVFETVGALTPDAVGVSATPRDNEGSYMPCFLAGVSAATALAATHGVPLYRFSHQAGHIAAALYACGREDLHHGTFLAFHVSGGTTELTLVENGKITLLGGTKDISAGKAIDRIGVKLGLSFPCGKALDALAADPSAIAPGKLSVHGFDCNLSGVENKADELIAKGTEASYVAGYVLSHIGAVLTRMTENALAAYGDLPILYAGGVMSNRYLNRLLTERFGGLFAEVRYAADNAAGISRLTALTAEGVIPYVERRPYDTGRA